MNPIRRRAYAAAYKGQNNQSLFNPFAARGRPHRHALDEEVRVTSISDAVPQDEAASDTAYSLQQAFSTETSAGASHEMDETSTVSPKPSESSLRRTHSPKKTASTDEESLEGMFLHPLSTPSKPQDVPSNEGSAFSAASHGMDETSTISPKPSESSLRPTHSAPDKAASIEAIFRRGPGSCRAKLPGEPEKPSIDDMKPMQIIVNTLAAKPLTLAVTRNTTTEEIKMLIQDKEGTPPGHQRLLYAGRQLNPFTTLKDYGLQPNSTLHMVLRLQGGGEGLDFVRVNSNAPPPKPPYTFSSQMRAIFLNSWAHLLMLFIPAGFAVYYCHVNQIVVFTINFLAIIPSAVELAFGVDQLSLHVGETLEGLISMTFSNAVQLITSIFLLKQRQIDVLQTSLIGSILSNLLLMTGLGFFVGGLHRFQQFFNVRIAQLLGSLLLLASMSILVPTISPLFFNTSREGKSRQAHGTAIMLLLSYCFWLYFQLRTHPEFFSEPSQHEPSLQPKFGTAKKAIGVVGAKAAGTAGGALIEEHIVEEEEEEAEQPQLTIWTAIGTIVISTVLIAFNTQFATESIDGLLDQAGLTPTFVGLVILPLLSNDPTTLIVAYKDKMDLSLELTMGKCMQTALMVVPLVVIIGWGMGVEDMTLQFNGFEVASLFASILIVNHIVQDGQSTWIQGVLLVEAYVIVAIAAYFVP